MSHTRSHLLVWAVLLVTPLGSCGLFLRWPQVDIAERPLAKEPARAIRAPGLIGAEDITIDPTSGLAFISCTDRWQTRASVHPGSLWTYDLARDVLRRADLESGIQHDSFRPHGIGLWRDATNGNRLFVINHRERKAAATAENTVEIFTATAGQLQHVETISDRDSKGQRVVFSLNDITAVGPRSFFATHPGRAYDTSFLRDLWDGFGSLFFWKLHESSIVFFDGTRYRHVAAGLGFANGITAHPSKDLLYVSTSLTSELRVYTFDRLTGQLKLLQTVVLGAMLDNLEWTAAGDLLVAAHTGAWSFFAHSIWNWDGPGHVLRVPISDDGLIDTTAIEQILAVSGDDAAGLSVAALYDRVLLIGQVFRQGIHRFDLER